MKEPLFGKSYADLQKVVLETGLPSFTARQMTDWLYKRHVSTIDEMTNISRKNRELLTLTYDIGLTSPIEEQ